MTALLLVKLVPADSDALADLHAASLSECWSAFSLRALLSDPLIQGWGIRREEAWQAFIIMRQVADEAEILTLVTSEAARRNGLARRLLKHTLAQLPNELPSELPNDEAITVHLELRASNHAAQHLYRQQGFILSGERRHYYPDGEHALLMKRVLEANRKDNEI